MSHPERYIPAASYDVLTPLYDPALRFLFREATWKPALVAQARIGAGMTVLDLGCGTGTLTMNLKTAAPDALVAGLDGDNRVLAIASRRAAIHHARLELVRGLAVPLPFGNASFDRVVASLLLHHLSFESKRLALSEIARVLRPAGELHIADFGAPHSLSAAIIGRFTKRFEEVGDNLQGWLPILCRTAGLVDVAVTANYMTSAGTLSLLRGRKPIA